MAAQRNTIMALDLHNADVPHADLANEVTDVPRSFMAADLTTVVEWP